MRDRRHLAYDRLGPQSEIRVLSGRAIADNDHQGVHGFDEMRETLVYHLDVQSSLCSALERLADNLPGAVKPNDCLALARGIPAIIKRAHRFEEDVLFPYMCAHASTYPGLRSTLDRLHGEHWEDESYADELHLELAEFVDGDARNSEKLGYMLRGFFEGLRRHVAFEREHLLPMLDGMAVRI